MHVFFLFTGSGPLVILSSYASVKDPSLLRKLASKGIEKFLAYEICASAWKSWPVSGVIGVQNPTTS